jgi:hypothetical protein
MEVKNARSRLILYLENAKIRGQRAFLKEYKLAKNGINYELESLLKNKQLNEKNGSVNNPAEQTFDCLEDTGQQESRTGRHRTLGKRTLRRKGVTRTGKDFGKKMSMN